MEKEDMNKAVENFDRKFFRFVPFGRAGSDKEFAKVMKKYVDFKSAYDLWSQNKEVGN